MPRRRKRPVRTAKRPTPPLPVTVLGVTYAPKPKEPQYTPEAQQIKLH